jgi:CMP-N,N'-diacetyllegionaminic acid synthase
VSADAVRDPGGVLAVVPARGGSKGVPGKNLRSVGGLSLVARAAVVAHAVPRVERAVLSTDDPAIADAGRRAGLEVPFLRPAELSGDLALGVDAWRHAWLTSEEVFGRRFEVSVLLEPSSPLREAVDVERTLDALLGGPHLVAATVSPTPAHYTPHKTLVIDDAGHLRPLLDPADSPSLRQLIPAQHHRNGLCYAALREAVIDRRTIVEDRCVAVVVERPVVNVDTELDLELAAWLLQRASTAGRAVGGGA